ncbi:putative calponin -like proteiny domain-containing protein-like [Capsicum annuum]|nr:putative calponin -like proteiny domain-containing protein-like [Capsicum annuum]KAF3640208.1 putative calponin -like proteiny domain-containing protein-like [Capsicum annuum]
MIDIILLEKVCSFTIIRTEEESHFLGYLKDIYENKKGEKSVGVQLFQHFQEVQCVIPELGGYPREVLITSRAQVMYAKCIDAPAAVLTPGDYEKNISLVLKNFSSSLSFEVGGNLEVLCHESGMRGCWFRCKALQLSGKYLKVQYDDIQDCGGLDKLGEWIPSYRIADSDKLGMRYTGHLIIRPRHLVDSSDYSLEVRAAVDAWWSDGWWEGVIAEIDAYGRGHLQVYFPGKK